MTRTVQADETNFSGFVFKIQAMDPAHRDRIACGYVQGNIRRRYEARHVRLNRDVQFTNAVTWQEGGSMSMRHIRVISLDFIIMARFKLAWFTPRRRPEICGIPHFAPEIFRRVRLLGHLQ
ncbi:MAG: hypothetical protein R3E08_11935 [Thiotrichaceae bacterium]